MPLLGAGGADDGRRASKGMCAGAGAGTEHFRHAVCKLRVILSHRRRVGNPFLTFMPFTRPLEWAASGQSAPAEPPASSASPVPPAKRAACLRLAYAASLA